MTLSLAAAMSTKQALKAKAATLFSAVQGNVTIHDCSHWSEQAARAALQQKTSCGYYYRIKSEKFLKHKKATLPDKPFENMSRKAAKNWDSYTKVERLNVDANDCLNLVNLALISSAAVYKKSTANPNTRFLLISPMPKGYGGETLHRGGVNESCSYIALVLVAGTGVNAAIVTHFPCAPSYFNNMDDLI